MRVQTRSMHVKVSVEPQYLRPLLPCHDDVDHIEDRGETGSGTKYDA